MALDKRLWVVIAAYNEGKVIGEVVSELRQMFEHVVVVDDGSVDATGEAARAAGAMVLKHCLNLGQGAALQTGIDYALLRGAPFVATFDADGQHDPHDLAVMLERLQDSASDVALGSRFLGAAPGMPFSRRLLLKLALVFQRISTGLALSDAHNGLRILRASAASKLRIDQNRMAHASEIIAKIAQSHLTVVEVPCTIRYTDYSKRKGQRLVGSFDVLVDLLVRKLYR